MPFSDEQIHALVTALPGCVDAHRRSLLPRVLKEWGGTDLNEHLTRPLPKQIVAERQQIEKVARLAHDLARAMAALETDGRSAIAHQRLAIGSDSPVGQLQYEEICEADRRLHEAPRRLELLAEAATKASMNFVPLPLRQSSLVRYLVLLDLAAIYEWATQQRAGRRVTTDLAADAGKTYGPFWEFAVVAWQIIFGSPKGLDNALKKWASARRRHREFSPLIANLDMSHPQWRIREVARSRSTIRKD